LTSGLQTVECPQPASRSEMQATAGSRRLQPTLRTFAVVRQPATQRAGSPGAPIPAAAPQDAVKRLAGMPRPCAKGKAPSLLGSLPPRSNRTLPRRGTKAFRVVAAHPFDAKSRKDAGRREPRETCSLPPGTEHEGLPEMPTATWRVLRRTRTGKPDQTACRTEAASRFPPDRRLQPRHPATGCRNRSHRRQSASVSAPPPPAREQEDCRQCGQLRLASGLREPCLCRRRSCHRRRPSRRQL